MVYYLLAMEIQKNRGIIKEDSEFAYKTEDFEVEERQRPREEEEQD